MTTLQTQLSGIDVGGTFTDFFFFDEATGRYGIDKRPTTIDNQSVGLVDGVANYAPLDSVGTIVHGTTTGTNAILERKGARVGVITTRGFRDSLEMRRRDRPNTWGLSGNFDPLATRDLRIEVTERTLANGEIKTPLDLDDVKAAARQLLHSGAESVAIVFINAYANPQHEQAARDAVATIWPNDWINCSSDILPEIREFERGSTTAMNAYLQPVVGRYLATMSDTLMREGFDGEVYIVQSNGGVMTLNMASRLPVRTALSGPAAGVMAASHIAQQAGFDNIITCDLGGTSFDVSLISKGKSVLAAQTTIDFGLVIRTPMVEITTIGAGGGSIARVDAGGILQVGPQSAGSQPGPVCYGHGNPLPTLTDANVVLGRINATRPIGGGLVQLDVDAALQAIDTHIAQPLSLGVHQAAEAIVRVANSRMAGAIRLVSIERGHDPKHFAAMPFGGGGGLHTGAVMKEVGLARSLVPRYPGITSAMGCLMADMRHDRVQTLNLLLESTDFDDLNATMQSHSAQLSALLDDAGVTFEARDTEFEFDMSYVGQTHTVSVAISLTSGKQLDQLAVRTAFVDHYKTVYGRTLDGQAIRINALRTAVIGRRPRIDLSALAPDNTASVDSATMGEREVWFDGAFIPTPVYDRLSLPAGAVINGPAVLEQSDATVIVDPDLEAEVDALGNLILQRWES